MSDITDYTRVVAVSPDLIQIEVSAEAGYLALDRQLEIGSYVEISDDAGVGVIAVVQSYRIKEAPRVTDGGAAELLQFVIDTQPVGRLEDGVFKRGGKQITIPPRHVEIASAEVMARIYAGVPDEKKFQFSHLAQDPDVAVHIDGDRFFGKHVGVVGSTGSGKSNTVAKLIQQGVAPSGDQKNRGVLNNSHVIIFDIHGEYSTAFPAANVITSDDLVLPYWLMNAEELEEMFIESREQNSHNQVSQFRAAVIQNKRKYAGSAVSYDAPVYFSLAEVQNYLTNLNSEVIGKLASENKPKLADGTLVDDRADHYFDKVQAFVETSAAAATKASNGPFAGEFNRFVMRLESRRVDERLDFLLAPSDANGKELRTEDLAAVVSQFLGYGDSKSNVTILDLSGVPFEVLTTVVSLVSRIVFTVGFNFKKRKAVNSPELPFLLVYEEAHNYVPQHDGARFGSVKKSIERIAKEGRKYGISLMVVSQRPSEVSETIFSQCNNFVAMRLTNPSDQSYVRRLLPDNLGAVVDSLPTLEQQEAVVIGDSIALPSVVRVDDVVDKPNSRDIAFRTEWRGDWLDVAIQDVVQRGE